MSATLKRFSRRTALAMLGAVGVSGFAGSWYAAGQLITPPRRAIQPYHLDWLKHAASHGLRIHAWSALRGQVPCLFVEPDAIAGPGVRAKGLRKQLRQRGHALTAYGTTSGTLVLLHWRKGRKEDLLPIAERFCAAGFRCLLPDLPGHGDSPLQQVGFGSTPFEAELPHLLLAEAKQRFSLAEQAVGLWGMSMGSAFAVSAARINPDIWRGLVLINGFAALDQVIEEQLGDWVGPLAGSMSQSIAGLAELRSGAKYAQVRPAHWAAAVSCPVLLVHSQHDSVVDISQGKVLYAAFATADKHWLTVAGANHSGVLATAMPVYALMAEWLLRRLR